MSNLRDRLANLSPEKRALIERQLAAKEADAADRRSIPRRESDSPAPLSFAQERLWFLDQLEPDSARFNVPRPMRLRGPLDLAALRQALEEIVARHEVLRTNYVAENGNPTQVVSEDAALPLAQVDLSGVSLEEQEAEVLRRCKDEMARRFDLTHDRLIRGLLLRLKPDEQILFLTMHHIVSDGWSKDILARELNSLYIAFREGRPSPLPPLPIQYADYAAWQRSRLGETLDRQISYWKERLAEAPTLLELPLDRPRPATATYVGAKTYVELPGSFLERLKALSRSEGATLFMTLLAAFNLLLARYSGQEDIVVGSPIANRNHKEIEGLIGFFLNMLALRTDLSGDPSFLDLLGRVRETALGAYAHQDLPFEKLLEEIHPERSLSHTPVFQVMFNLLSSGAPSPSEALSYGSLKGSAVKDREADSEEISSNFDLTLYARDRANGLSLTLVYNVELFDAATARQLLGQFVTLLGNIVDDPSRRLSELSLLTDVENERLECARNSIGPINPFVTFTAEQIEQTIHARFAQQVKTYPQQIAVQTRRHRWSYETLNRESNRVACQLLAEHGQQAQRIGLLFEQGAPLLASMLGVLKSGHTYVPLDPVYPRERLAYFLRDSGAGTVLTDQANLALAHELAAPHGAQVILLEDRAATGPDCEPVGLPSSPDSLAYILYTSGSTGEPKGVMQSHRNILHHIRCYTNNLHLTSSDRLSLFASYGFDAAVMDIYGALLNGATLCPCNTKEESIAGLSAWVREQQITVFHSTPTLFRFFISTLAEEDRFPQVRLVVLGGEAAFRRDVESYRKHFSSESLLVNGLGPTESTVTLQCFMNHETLISSNAAPVGYAVEATQVVLLSPFGRVVEGVGSGEIGICSAHVALGYWQKPEQTAAAFQPTSTEKVRIYRTGDRGRRRTDGSIEFLGRQDHQVKLRGYRIELGEIETQLCRHPGVREALVMAHNENAEETYLAAYIVGQPEAPASESELRAFLKDRLPEYMTPSAFLFLEALPLTPNGKVDRRALPAPMARTREDAYIAPCTAIEIELVKVFSQVLGRERVGVNDNFFELGGHSLMAVRLMSEIQRTFGKRMPLQLLFRSATVGALARELLGEMETNCWANVQTVTPMRPGGTRVPIFCVAAPGVNSLGYLALGRHVGNDQPFYVLQTHYRSNFNRPYTRTELRDVAEANIQAMRTVCPVGPFYLAGMCEGAHIAFEMARHLQEAGEIVPTLVTFDSWPEENTRTHFGFWQNRVALMRLNRKRGSAASMVSTATRIAWITFRALQKWAIHLVRPPDPDSWEARYWPGRNFVPPRFKGRILVLRVKKQAPWRIQRQDLGWTEWATDGVEVYNILGTHATILREPHVAETAGLLRRYIDDIQSRQNPQLTGAAVVEQRSATELRLVNHIEEGISEHSRAR